MAATLQSTFLVRITGLLSEALDLASRSVPIKTAYEQEYANGTSTAQADLIFMDTRTITQTAATDALDLQASLTDPLGAAFTPTKLRGIIVKASASNTADVVIGNVAAAVPIFGTTTGSIAICPGGVFCMVDPVGVPVTATTGDIIQIANGATNQGSVVYDIIMVGTSA